MAKLFEKSELPEGIFQALEKGEVTYRGCGMGRYCGNFRIKYKKKEYMVSDDLFNELWSIKRMEFTAPYRKQ